MSESWGSDGRVAVDECTGGRGDLGEGSGRGVEDGRKVGLESLEILINEKENNRRKALQSQW